MMSAGSRLLKSEQFPPSGVFLWNAGSWSWALRPRDGGTDEGTDSTQRVLAYLKRKFKKLKIVALDGGISPKIYSSGGFFWSYYQYFLKFH